ncbi:serine hydrolase domain-containing protein [Neobacillus vireti]|uniref:Beta-lactamase n=1 Tax=Neobacillus vireti LMG 21834 TaxID=1131730 RepID=A0AB94INP4_9BACI|nr:serine hydrolase domain-containing protein [Neobacillus vireti]ETI68578.1 beta-lactamase [Neobacillus vireti LMG 21834]KLT16555.1 beta-lactamase [Neobacillus vireti]
MKSKTIILSTVCTVFFGTATAFASSDAAIVPTIEKKEKSGSTASEKPHPVFTWNSNLVPVSSVLHPGSAKGAGMVTAPLQQIDQIMNQAISEKVMPGAVAFVARGGTIVKHTAYGKSAQYTDGKFTEMENPVSMKEDTIFDLASISKIFTATAVMVLYEQGLFALDDPVAKYIPEFAANGKENVTIRQLLTHTSGFVSWIPLYSQGNSRDERLQLVFRQPLKNPPGTAYEYSDLNMITLGALVERLSGKRQDVFVKEHITGPLGMKDTMYNPPASLKKRIAATEFQATPNRGLVWGEVHDENAWSLDGVAGHAGVFSTAEDLAKLTYIFINDGKYGGKRILKPATIKLLLENQNERFPGDDHGLGWELGQGWYMDALSEGTYSFGHTGYTGTSIVVSPNNKTIAILLTNRVHPSRNTVSTNQTRRLFARQVADAIPVSIPGKDSAWFAGYGDQVNRVMEAPLNLKKDAKLTFSTWYMTEFGWDFGNVEIFQNGAWKKLTELTGTSNGWEKKEVIIPKDAEKLRFVYKTDTATNGRGWYVLNPKLDSSVLKFSSNEWELRNY